MSTRLVKSLPCNANLIFRVFAALVVSAPFLFAPLDAMSQVLNQREEPKAKEMPKATVAQEIKGTVKVNVDVDKRRGFLAPRALGVVFPNRGTPTLWIH